MQDIKALQREYASKVTHPTDRLRLNGTLWHALYAMRTLSIEELHISRTRTSRNHTPGRVDQD